MSERHQRHTPLQRLLRQAVNQETWTADLRALLPADIGGRCRVFEVRGSVVLVSCSNAATATRLRFLVPDLLAKLNALRDFRHATDIKIQVNPES